MNDTLTLMQSHRTYREFDPDFVISSQEIDEITCSAQQAPSWMNGQHYSIINITDPTLREKIGALQPRNPQIVQASVFFVFVADLYRIHLASQAYNGSMSAVTDIDTLFTATTDTALAAQNAVNAAESLGYGICLVGGLRTIAPQLTNLLDLPKYTFPLFGLAVGKPTTEMRVKPRLPKEAVVFNNQYKHDLDQYLASYEQTMLDFGEKREKLPWREKFARYYENPYAPQNHDLLIKQQLLAQQRGVKID